MAHAHLSAAPAPGDGHRLNAFPLIIPAGATLPYRIWDVDPVPTTPEVREKIRSSLWRKSLRRPVLATHVGDRYAYAVARWDGEDPVTYTGEGERLYTIRPTDDRRTIRLDALGGFETDLAAAMLQGEIMLHLRGDRRLSRGHDNAHVYSVAPDRAYNPGLYRRGARSRRGGPQAQAVDIFRGFTYRVIVIEGVGSCLVLDVRTTYVGRETLASYLEQGQRPGDIERQGGFERWVVDYGQVKQTVLLIDGERRTIGEIAPKGDRTVYDHLRATYPHLGGRIAPGDRGATMAYRREDLRNEAKHYTGDAALLKPQFTTQSRPVRESGDSPAFGPRERVRRVEAALAHVRGAKLAGAPISFGPALRCPATVVPLPGLIFGPPEARAVVRADLAADERAPHRRWGALKTASLRTHGPYKAAEFTNPYLVYPASLEKDGLIDHFVEQTTALCAEYGRVSFDPQTSSYVDGAHPRDIIAKVKGIAEGGRCGFVLLALPTNDRDAAKVYAGIKSQVSLPSKCFASAKLRSKAGDTGKLSSYLLGNTLGLLVENGTRPWGLADALAHEMQIGFDAARYREGGLMGAAIVGDVSGGDLSFVYEEIEARERIPAKVIGPVVLRALEGFFVANGRAPRTILFQRDGRLLETERKGIRAALDRFARAHPEQPRPAWAAITIEKTTSVPLRLVRERGGDIDAPLGGAYVLQNASVGYIVLAGYPMRQGTPRPVRVEVVDGSGDADIRAILRDIFLLAQLNWSSPEIAISLPLTLRFADEKLERYALEVGGDDGEDDADDWEGDDEAEDDGV